MWSNQRYWILTSIIFKEQRKLSGEAWPWGTGPHLSSRCHSNCQDSRWPIFLSATTPLSLTQLLLLSSKLLPSDLPVLIHLRDLIFAVRTGISVNLMRLFPAFYFHYLETVCIKSGWISFPHPREQFLHSIKLQKAVLLNNLFTRLTPVEQSSSMHWAEVTAKASHLNTKCLSSNFSKIGLIETKRMLD